MLSNLIQSLVVAAVLAGVASIWQPQIRIAMYVIVAACVSAFLWSMVVEAAKMDAEIRIERDYEFIRDRLGECLEGGNALLVQMEDGYPVEDRLVSWKTHAANVISDLLGVSARAQFLNNSGITLPPIDEDMFIDAMDTPGRGPIYDEMRRRCVRLHELIDKVGPT